MIRRIDRVAWTALGLACAAAAVLAPQIGLDANNDWGPSRRLLLAAGVVLVAIGWRRELARLVQSARWAIVALANRLSEATGLGAAAAGLAAAWRDSSLRASMRALAARAERGAQELLRRSGLLRTLFGTRLARVSFAVWSAFALVSLSYLWFVSVGTWTRFRSPSAYQELQAEAFLHGQTALLREPEAELLALDDPYDPAARASVRHLWDASLYRGRYYLYWGPVPALLLVPVKAAADVHVGDDVLVFVFSVGSLYWVTRLLLRVWKDTFQRVPGWAVVAGVFAVGWANPSPWMLNSPWIYESAIVGGQMFFLMGIYALYPVLCLPEGRPATMAWAGASLALAVGTRVSLAVAVGAVCLVVVLRVLDRLRNAAAGSVLAAFFLPLAAGAVLLAGYNQARFDSPFEFGQRYQLTSLDLPRIGSASTSLRNVPPNLYNYLVNPVRTLTVFPYIKPVWGGRYMSVFRIPVPPDYYSRQITGVLLAAPFVLFGLVSVAHVMRRQRRADAAPAGDAQASTFWLEAALIAVGIGSFVVALLYIVASMRYLGDFVPGLMLLATLGFWRGLSARASRGAPAGAFTLFGVLGMAWTAAAGLLLGVTSYHARFEVLNPELFHKLTEWFTF